jgi:glycerol-3-phosphate dehydrogenase
MAVGEISVDVLVLGGGIAGLWTLARLRGAGYSCLLVEKTALGSGQTIASQGIIHGGIKYALTGAASRASKAIAEMPAIWRGCLAGGRGQGELDLSGVRVLSDHQLLWTTGGIASRLAGVAASKAIRTEVARVAREEYPPAFVPAPKSVHVYRVDEPVLDPRSLLERLGELSTGAIVHAPEISIADAGREGATVVLRRSESAGGELNETRLRARRLIFAAGAGNEELLAGAPTGAAPMMQRRRLHMIMVRAKPGVLPPVFGHCVGLSDTPRITISTQTDSEGRTVWYLGGQIAESGVERDRQPQIDAAIAETRACLPWIDLLAAEWATLRISRAEGLTAGGERPDEAVVVAVDPAIAVWPTKLAFAPAVASRVLALLGEQGITPSGAAPPPVGAGEAVPIAPLPWEDRSVRWS